MNRLIRKEDAITALSIAALLPLYYKIRFLLQGLIEWGDVLHPTLIVEYLFSTVLGFGMVALHRRSRASGVVGFLLTATAGAAAAVIFTVFYYSVIFPFGASRDFLFDIAVLALLVPLIISGVSERILFQRRAEQAEQAALRERYASLESRMSPHFLFNALSTLTDIIEEDQALAVEFVEQAAVVYRYIIDHQYSSRVPLAEELTAARALFFIMEARHPGALKLRIHSGANSDSFETVPLAVQSLIENALKHNRVTSAAPLEISIRREGDSLLVENTRMPKVSPAACGTGLADLSERVAYVTGRQLRYWSNERFFSVRLPLSKA